MKPVHPILRIVVLALSALILIEVIGWFFTYILGPVIHLGLYVVVIVVVYALIKSYLKQNGGRSEF